MQKMSDFSVVPRRDNKGFTIHHGENYVGYIVIGENKVPEEAVVRLQNPVNMAAVLKGAELRPFKPAENNDISYLDDILGGGETQEQASSVPNTVEGFDEMDQQNVS